MLALLVGLLLAANAVLQGAMLGKLVTGLLPENRGKIILGGIDWPLRLLGDLVTGAPTPVKVDGLEIYDPEGRLVLWVPHLETRVKVGLLIFKGSFSIHDLKVPRAYWRFAKMKTQQGIGFLAALEPKNPPPPAPAGKEPGPGSFFHIVNAELHGFHAILDFPGAWGVNLQDVDVPFATLHQSTVDPKHPFFIFDAQRLESKAPGHLMILDNYILPFDQGVSVAQVATLPEYSDDIFVHVAEGRTARSRLVGKGFFTGIYGENSISGIKMHVAFSEAADALLATAHGEHLKLYDLRLAGPGAQVAADLHGPWEKLKIEASFAGLDAAWQSWEARKIGFGLTFEGEGLKVGLQNFGASAPDGGRLSLQLGFDAGAMALHAQLGLDRFSTATYVPPSLRQLAAGTVSGGLTLDADLNRKSARLKRLDLRVERARAAGLPRSIRVHGEASASPELVQTSGLEVEVPGAGVKVKGEVNLARQAVALGLEATASDLGSLLQTMKLPPLARAASVTAQVGGTFSSPEIDGRVSVQQLGVPGMAAPELHTRFGLHDGVVRIDELGAEMCGGTIEARGEAQLFNHTLKRMLRAPVLDLVLAGRGIDIERVIESPTLQGKISFEVRAKGSTSAPEALVTIPGGTPLRVMGDDYLLGPIELALAGDVVEVRSFKIARVKGGSVDIKGRAPLHGAIALDLVLDRWPLTGIPGVVDAGVPIEGTVDAALHLGGTLDKATAKGELRLAGVSVRGTPFGDGRLLLSTDEQQTLHVEGDLFRKFHVAGTAAYTKAGLAAHGVLEFEKLVLQEVYPELATVADARGTASGRAAVDLEPGKPLSLDVLLRELQVSLAREVVGADGETAVQRVDIGLQKPMHVTVVGDRIVLAPTQLSTHGGGLEVVGELDGEKVNGSLRGHLDLELVQPFIRDSLDRLSGDVSVQLLVAGTTGKPLPRGTVAIDDPIRVRPKGFPTDVVVPSGAIEIGRDAVALRTLAVAFDGAVMKLSGEVGLDAEYRPDRLAASIDGEISAKLLEYAAPDAVIEAGGRARIKGRLRGTLDKPQVEAGLDLGTIDLRLRDVGRDLQIQSGKLDVSNAGAKLHDVRILVDGRGELLIGDAGLRPGKIEFKSVSPFELGYIDLPLHGERMGYRVPESLEIDDVAFDLALQGDLEEGFELGGEVRLVSGRFVQDFSVNKLVVSPRIDESASAPFWENNRLLEDLGLDLKVVTVGDGFLIQNSIAPELHMVVNLHVGGTLSEMALGGEIRPTDGRLRIPMFRGDFDLTSNVSYVRFEPTKSLEKGYTPELELQAQNLVTDLAGVDHNVRLRISGPIREAQLDLSTDDGLDRTQTLLLLMSGRAPTDLQRTSTTAATVGSNVSPAGDIVAQVSRDAMAQLLQPYINETVSKVFNFQLIPTVGTDGFMVTARKRISRTLSLQGDAFVSFQNTQRYTVQGSFWIVDWVTAAIRAEQILNGASNNGINYTPPASGSAELRWDFPVRW